MGKEKEQHRFREGKPKPSSSAKSGSHAQNPSEDPHLSLVKSEEGATMLRSAEDFIAREVAAEVAQLQERASSTSEKSSYDDEYPGASMSHSTTPPLPQHTSSSHINNKGSSDGSSNGASSVVDARTAEEVAQDVEAAAAAAGLHNDVDDVVKRAVAALQASGQQIDQYIDPAIGGEQPAEDTSRKRKRSHEVSFVCPVCDISFPSEQTYYLHKRTHAGSKDNRCSICKKSYTQYNNLVMHRVTIHQDLVVADEPEYTPEELSSLRVFHCNQSTCQATFTSYEKLLVHKYEQHGTTNSKRPYKKSATEKIHVCNHDGCTKSFSKASDLTRHRRTHTGERPFQCDSCNASFAQKYRLTTHRRIHTGEKPFSCTFCGKQFARGDAVRAHIFAVHRSNGESW
ncbi:hypothetical protein DIRU0_C08284 [Diutina rugosa]